MSWLADTRDQFDRRTIHRFDPRYWTINFPRPMMGALLTSGSDGLELKAVFARKSDLLGLIWSSEDELSHPLTRYETNRDYRQLTLSFHWQSTGIIPLDGVNGPTLTIEGRDQAGFARTWYVRLWNYATGTPEDAMISLDFGAMNGGFLLPSEADPVWAGDIDRMFISLVPPDYDPTNDGPVADDGEASLTIGQIQAGGGNHVLMAGDDHVKQHLFRMANGYDDVFSQTPERVIEQGLRLGYRDWINHYVGMSHYYKVAWDGDEERFILLDSSQPLNEPTRHWHRDYFERAAAYGFQMVVSLSYELFYANVPLDWTQRTAFDDVGLTGWDPPSALVPPGHPDAMDYLARVFIQFGTLAQNAGLNLIFQIGEPWWWTQLDDARTPCFYDATTMAAYGIETGRPVPTRHITAYETPNPDQQDYLDWLGARLGQSTLSIRDQVRQAFPNADFTLLFYTPQVLVPDAPMLSTVNLPDQWAAPAFNFLQLEDYDHVIDGDFASRGLGLDRVRDVLGYARENAHYFAGFVLNDLDANAYWPRIAKAADLAIAEGYSEVFIWAYPQIQRDGYVANDPGDSPVIGFHDVEFPRSVGFGSSGGPEFATEVVQTGSGYETRNQRWAQARARYDVSSGLKSEADIADLIAFFRARRGRAFAFRFRDWADYRSSTDGGAISAFDQELGTGDGVQVSFNLIKKYGPNAYALERPISHVRVNSLIVGIDGVQQSSGWQLSGDGRTLVFESPPGNGLLVTAGFEFDVPVRFDSDMLDISWDSFGAGQLPAITLVEVAVGEISP